MSPQPASNFYYILYCLGACGYFSTAAIQSWPNPIPFVVSDGTGGSSYYSPGHSYSSGSYHGRSSGGFGGGGK